MFYAPKNHHKQFTVMADNKRSYPKIFTVCSLSAVLCSDLEAEWVGIEVSKITWSRQETNTSPT